MAEVGGTMKVTGNRMATPLNDFWPCVSTLYPLSSKSSLGKFSSTDLILRVAVGVDVPIGAGWNVRYSFSESLGKNPISDHLDPPGSARLMNFQNLVGVVYRF